MRRQCANAISQRNVGYDSFVNTHNIIVKTNACQISHLLNVDACILRCQVSDFSRHISHSIKVTFLFFFQHLGSQGTKICGTQKIRCMGKAEKTLFISNADSQCDCLPACTTVSYNIEQNLVEFDFLKSYSKSRFPELFGFAK